MSKVVLSFLILFLLQGIGFAKEENPDSEKFETMKSKVLENIGKRRAAMDTFESCVRAASDRESFKACRKAHKETMEKLRPKERRDQRGRDQEKRDRGRGRHSERN